MARLASMSSHLHGRTALSAGALDGAKVQAASTHHGFTKPKPVSRFPGAESPKPA